MTIGDVTCLRDSAVVVTAEVNGQGGPDRPRADDVDPLAIAHGVRF